jgi:hypothetical protein
MCVDGQRATSGCHVKCGVSGHIKIEGIAVVNDPLTIVALNGVESIIPDNCVVADIFNILSTNYATVATPSPGTYTNVDPAMFEGTWSGTYSTNEKFQIQVSNVDGFRAKVKYQSGATVKYQDVLIKNSAFRIGDTKFTVTRPGTAQINTVVTSPIDGSARLNTAYATQDT